MITRRTTSRQTVRARDLRRKSTFPERMLWSVLRAHRLGEFHFRRQYPVASYFLDYVCPAIRLAVELDGMSHIATGVQDDQRSAALESEGWKIVRFTNDQVLQDRVAVAEEVLKIAEEMAMRRSEQPPSRPPPRGRGRRMYPGGRGQSGFSLLELILVLALLSLAAGMAAPTLGRFTRSRQTLDIGADLLTMAQYAQTQAVNQGAPHRLHVDTHIGAYWLTVQRDGAFRRLAASLGRSVNGAENLVIQWDTDSQAANLGYVQFNPDGSHDAAAWRILSRNGRGVRVVSESATEPFRVVDLHVDQEER